MNFSKGPQVRGGCTTRENQGTHTHTRTHTHTSFRCVWLCVVVCGVTCGLSCVCSGLENSLSARSRQPGTTLTTTAALEQHNYGSHTHAHSWDVLMQSQARRRKRDTGGKVSKIISSGIICLLTKSLKWGFCTEEDEVCTRKHCRGGACYLSENHSTVKQRSKSRRGLQRQKKDGEKAQTATEREREQSSFS